MSLRPMGMPVRVAGLYAAASLIYILVSDWMVGSTSAGWRPDLQTLKGVAFVLVTAGAIAFLIRRELTGRAAVEAAFEKAQADIEVERRFSDTMLECMPGILYLYDATGRFLRWNRSFEQISGYSPEEIRGMHPLQFFPPDQRPVLADRIGAVFREGQSSVEADFLRKDGTTVPYFFTGRRVAFEGSDCLVGVGIDISQLQEAQAALARSERRYRSTLDSILEGCQIIGSDWRYLYLNDAAAAQNRRPNAELLGRRMPDMWPGIEQTPLFALLRRAQDDRVATQGEAGFEFPDGSYGIFDVRVQPVPEGIFVLSVDVSQRHHAEQALRDLNESLERTVAERTAALQSALTRAEAADRTKSAFLATMSHELRTPLNSIIGFTGIVLKGLAGPLNAEQSKQLGMVQASARHLLELINDVLDISKIEAGEFQVQPREFDLDASVRKVTAALRPQAESKGLSIDLIAGPLPARLLSDQRRVEQVLLNLLGNAVKFTERGGITLTVDTMPGPAGDGLVRFRVADTGIGIRPEQIPSLFRPFRQLDSGLARQHEGTGLGLAICRRLAEFMEGNIEVESEWGRGSVFTFTLPLRGDTAPHPHSGGTP